VTPAVIVTGASGGVGRACVDALAARRVPVALVGRDEDGLRTVAERCRSAGVAASVHALDFSAATPVAIRACVDASIAAHGEVRAMIGTTAVYEPGPAVGDVTDEAWRQLGVNLVAPNLLASAIAEHLVMRGGGRIVHVSSVTAFVSRGGFGAYEASKAGMVAASRSMAVELGPMGVSVNTVAPGWIATPMTAHLLDGVDPADVSRLIPVGRPAEPDEIASVVTWLALDAPVVLTGQTLVVDGGQSARTDHLAPRATPTPVPGPCDGADRPETTDQTSWSLR
jgi:NAD(P)-dependent dehydrogenase (short-subunit alcohol dehydrogenase family)